MIYLEKKIAIFNEMVYLKKEKESKEKIEAEKARLDQALADKTREMDQKEKDLIARRIQLAKEQGYDQVMNTKEETRIEVLKKEQALFQDFIASLKEKLKAFRESEAYVQREGDIFKGILADVNEERITVHLMDQDRDRLEGAFNKIAEEEGVHLDFVSLEKKALGGFMVSDKEESFFINASFQAKIDSLNYELGKMLHNQLKVEGGMD
ncbi:hypothetical protein [Urinicoccus massiliensis]|uniref:hypothetical protein n=1 Tax=Urinicoccus massiliensis TaxID=1723382 RepID=UPI0009310263|nr:hypothetical protein [Urinicoccus massiliensis]